MAEFCKKCTEELFGIEAAQTINMGIKEDEITTMLCEGCGKTIWVTNNGEEFKDE